MLPDWLKDKKIGIFGYGVNNAALVVWLLKHGANDVVIYDRDEAVRGRIEEQGVDVQVEVGEEAFDRASDREVIFRTPGMHVDHPALVAARERGTKITSQTDLFLELCPARTVGVTGTKGKGTVASLLHHLLESGNQEFKIFNSKFSIPQRIYLAGNIGKDPFEFLDDLQKSDIVILELSSGQLQAVTHSPNLAIVLDISADHLDYHQTVGEYVDAKRSIVRYQGPGDVALLNLDSVTASSFALDAGGTVLYYSTTKSVDAGGFLHDDAVHYRDPRSPETTVSISLHDFQLPGPHNQMNAVAAVTAALILGTNVSDLQERIGTFAGMSHRLETVLEHDGIRWVNDSYATAPIATSAALHSFTEPVVLIVGGYDKGLDWRDLGMSILNTNVKKVLTIGATGLNIAKAALDAGYTSSKIESAQTLDRAVQRAAELAVSGDVVLLSPASASFDQFKNVTERGETFRRLVNEAIK